MARALILDFDNTLYDWVDQWHASFAAMMAEAARISGVPLTTIKAEARVVHQRHHTSEYAFLLEELPSLNAKGNELKKYESAIEAYRIARRRTLKLYPDVFETLSFLKSKGHKLVVFTESQSFYTIMRFKKLGFDGLIDILFTSEDHEIDEKFVKDSRFHPSSYYQLEVTQHRAVRKGRLKPDPSVLINILDQSKLNQENTIYVGDSLFKDITMANDAGLISVWAKYGESRSSAGYDLLREVSHWTDNDVAFDRSLKTQDMQADFTLETSFKEILAIV